MAFYLDILTSFMIYTTVVIVIEVSILRQFTASTSGLVISNVLQLLVFLQWAVRMFSEVRDKLSSVKQVSIYKWYLFSVKWFDIDFQLKIKVSYYGNSVPQESPHIVEQNRPPTGWPMTGNIKFENIVLRYQDYGVDVLKDITINIKAKEKIGMFYLILLANNKHMTFLFCVKNLHSENF